LLFPSKPSILIIDDDTSLLRVFTKIFLRNGYDVTVAAKGSEAIKKLHGAPFDVALIDFRLPDMEGTELFPFIQKASPKTIKIMLTGNASTLKCADGADALIGKPISPEKLLSTISTELKNRNIEA
jgi:DNA-binding NtrC family response regulator